MMNHNQEHFQRHWTYPSSPAYHHHRSQHIHKDDPHDNSSATQSSHSQPPHTQTPHNQSTLNQNSANQSSHSQSPHTQLHSNTHPYSQQTPGTPPNDPENVNTKNHNTKNMAWWKKTLLGLGFVTSLGGGIALGLAAEIGKSYFANLDTNASLVRTIEQQNNQLSTYSSLPGIDRVEELQRRNDELYRDVRRLSEERQELLRTHEQYLLGQRYPFREAPTQFSTLETEIGDYIIEVNKEEQMTRIWQRTDYALIAEAPSSTGLVPGNKERQGDLKTPDGAFKIVSVENSSHWLFEEKAGEYGPFFVRLDFGRWNSQGQYFPNQKGSIGIHSTPHIYELGKPASHGCVRLFEPVIRDWVESDLLTENIQGYILPQNTR